MIYYLKHNIHKLNWTMIGNVLGMVLIAQASLMVLPVIVDLIYQEGLYDSYLIVIGICLVVGYGLTRKKSRTNSYFAKDGMLAVGVAWIVVSFFGGLPFYLSGEIPSFVDCFFEAVSGFTTTGSSILTEVENLKHATLFWRSFTHWIGGMGILVFILALLPKSNDRDMHIMRAEAPGPTIGKLVPRMRQSAMILYTMYMGLTIIQVILLLIGKMPLFDALCNTFGTAGTGGFAIKNTSIGAYNNAYYEVIITVFMILFGVNFNMYYFLLIKDFKQVFKNEELRTYLGIILFSIICITLNILSMYNFDVFKSIRLASFQVGSIITTTGYSSCDYSVWPQLSKMILFLLTVCGASAGSTGGGVKVSRLLIIVKKIKLDIQKLLHPQKVEAITMDGKVVDTEVVNQIMAYFCSFIIIVGVLLFLVSFNNFDFETTVTSVMTCIGNVGPGFGLCGPMGNFSMFSDFSKIVLSFAMLIGRLEIYPIIIFLAPILNIRSVSKNIHSRKKRRSN